MFHRRNSEGNWIGVISDSLLGITIRQFSIGKATARSLPRIIEKQKKLMAPDQQK